MNSSAVFLLFREAGLAEAVSESGLSGEREISVRDALAIVLPPIVGGRRPVNRFRQVVAVRVRIVFVIKSFVIVKA